MKRAMRRERAQAGNSSGSDKDKAQEAVALDVMELTEATLTSYTNTKNCFCVRTGDVRPSLDDDIVVPCKNICYPQEGFTHGYGCRNTLGA